MIIKLLRRIFRKKEEKTPSLPLTPIDMGINVFLTNHEEFLTKKSQVALWEGTNVEASESTVTLLLRLEYLRYNAIEEYNKIIEPITLKVMKKVEEVLKK